MGWWQDLWGIKSPKVAEAPSVPKPVVEVTAPVEAHKETVMAAKKKVVRGARGTKIPKAFQGSASSRNDYLAGESVSKPKKKKR
jgi:hypothetical protein